MTILHLYDLYATELQGAAGSSDVRVKNPFNDSWIMIQNPKWLIYWLITVIISNLVSLVETYLTYN